MNLLFALLDWIRDRLGSRGRAAELLAIESHRFGDRLVSLLLDQQSPEFPGVIALWLCENPRSTRDCLILCADLEQIRGWLFTVRTIQNEDDERQRFRRQIEVKARAAIREQYESISATHLVLVATISRVTIKTKRGEFRQLDCVGVWLVDFVGMQTYHGRNQVAERVMRSIAKKVATIPDGPLLSWEQVLFDEPLPWLQWIEQFTRGYMRSATHVIQPPKPRRTHGQPPTNRHRTTDPRN